MNPPSIRFEPSVAAAYLALAASIATMMLSRNAEPSAGPGVAIALVADCGAIALLAALHVGTTHVLEGSPRLQRLSGVLQGLVLALLTTVCVFAQALFQKTGELLSVDMLRFFVGHAGELAGVTATALDFELGWLLATVAGLLLLSQLAFDRRVLRWARHVVLLLPLVLGLFDPFLERLSSAAVEPAIATGRPLYQGDYADFSRREQDWNRTDAAYWRRGLLTGLATASMMGGSEFEAIGADVTPEALYQPPHFERSAPGHVGRTRPNVLFVVLESLRYRDVGAYRTTATETSPTPFLDGLAVNGWRVDRAYSTIPHTTKALIGIYCGIFPRFETDVGETGPGGLAVPCLPHVLKQAGYRSAHFQTAFGQYENRLGLLANVGFDDHFVAESAGQGGWEPLGYLGIDDKAMVDPAIQWMSARQHDGTPFFLSLLTLATHHPYTTPGHALPIATPAAAREAYLRGVRYTDSLLRELMEKMDQAGLLENTLVVITGDHGEAFGERGQIGHNGVGYEEGIRVPLVLVGPMLKVARVVGGLRQHIDLMPTVLDLVGQPWSGKLPGRSLISDTRGHSEIIASCFYDNYCLAHVAEDGVKTLYFHGKRSLALYDLGSDPDERHNLLAVRGRDLAVARLKAAIRLRKSYAAIHDGEAEKKVGAGGTAANNRLAVGERP